MKISYFIFFSFLFILLLFSITTYINSRQSEKVKENTDYLTMSSEIVRQSSRFQRNILNMVSGLRGYLLTGESYFVQTYDSAVAENETILKELAEILPDTALQQVRLDEIRALNERWVTEFASPLRQAKMESSDSDSSLAAFNKLYRERFLRGNERNIHVTLQQKFRELSNYEYDSRENRRQILAKSVQRTRNISFILTTLSVIAAFFIVGFLAYRISTPIVKMVNMANSIGAGYYNVRMPVKGKDELSKLGHSLNKMAALLSENISLLRKKNEELDQFAHIVSHDLKAPLRGIDNVVGWIEEDHSTELSPKVRDYLTMIKGRINRGQNLIEGILSYARVGKEDKKKEEVDIQGLLTEIIENIELKPGLRIEIQPGMPVLNTYRLPLLQVLTNLINNAVKYHDKPKGHIQIYFKDRGSHYEFYVEDDGPGIAKAYHDKIFVIFQTLQERDRFESTGVGLAIVKKILDTHKERIRVSSVEGKGSVFSFTWSK